MDKFFKVSTNIPEFRASANPKNYGNASDRGHYYLPTFPNNPINKNDEQTSLSFGDNSQTDIQTKAPVNVPENKKPSPKPLNLAGFTLQAPAKPKFMGGFTTEISSPSEAGDISGVTTTLPDERIHSHRIITSPDLPIRQSSPQPQPNIVKRNQTPLAQRTRSKSTLNMSHSMIENNSKVASHTVTLNRSGNLSQTTNDSPVRTGRRGGSEKYWCDMTDQVVSDEKRYRRTMSSLLSAGTSQKSFRSDLSSDSPLKSVLGSSIKQCPKVASLGKVRLVGNPAFHEKAKRSISTVRIVLDEALDEKTTLKTGVTDMRQALKDGKVDLEKMRENIQFLALCMTCLGKKNENLDKNTTGLQALAYRAREDILQLQEELRSLGEKNTKAKKQIEVESERVRNLEQATKILKLRLLEELKQRNAQREQTEASRMELMRTMDLYESLVNDKQNKLMTLEELFQKYSNGVFAGLKHC